MRKRTQSQLWLLGIYGFALLVGLTVFRLLLNDGMLWAMLTADITATLVVWMAGLLLKNASVYDPYWSIAPPVIVLGWMLVSGFRFASVLMLLALLIWSIRLTYNFLVGWEGLDHQDWRYGMLKEKNPKLWVITNLFGINLFPTLIVFICLIPAYMVVTSKAQIDLLFVIGFIMCIAAALIQYISDEQMRVFRKTKQPGLYIDTGVWRYSRHPNYFGEVLMWWGVWVMQFGINQTVWMTILGPVAMTALFLWISIPMMETRILGKCEGYREYQETVSILIPWARRKSIQEEACE